MRPFSLFLMHSPFLLSPLYYAPPKSFFVGEGGGVITRFSTKNEHIYRTLLQGFSQREQPERPREKCALCQGRLPDPMKKKKVALEIGC